MKFGINCTATSRTIHTGYVISIGNHTFECNSRIIVPVTLKKLQEAKPSAILFELHENACDCLLIA